jgi:hypothetical protein
VGQPLDEISRQTDIPHFSLRLIEWIFDAIKFKSSSLLIPDHKTSARIAISWLSDRSGIDQELLLTVTPYSGELVELIGWRVRWIARRVVGEHGRKMGMPEKSDALVAQSEIFRCVRGGEDVVIFMSDGAMNELPFGVNA